MDEAGPGEVEMAGEAPSTTRSGHEGASDATAADAAEPGRQRQRPARPRGRHAKDPLAQVVSFKCQRIEDMQESLGGYLANPSGDREHTTLEFSFPVTAAFLVSAREPIAKTAKDTKIPYLYSSFNKTAVSIVDALHTIKDAKEQALMQKRISKTLVEAIAQTDGYRYSFHNHWISREDQASRFSYYCNDSVLNKGRAANEGAQKLRDGVKVRKEVFECQGLVSVKFSVTKMSLEVHYKHIPLHATYEERAPPPRKNSKRRKLLEIFHPEKLPQQEPKEKRRRSTPAGNPPNRKRRATQPPDHTSLQGESVLPPANDSSLQPLYDFLGSAEDLDRDLPRNEEPVGVPPTAVQNPVAAIDGAITGEPLRMGGHDPAGTSNPAAVARSQNGGGESALTTAMDVSRTGNATPRRSRTTRRISHHEEAPRAMRTGPIASNSGPSDPARPSIRPEPVAPTLPPLDELELLRMKLQEAEQKIRDLEAEKSRSTVPVTWAGGPQPPPPLGYSPHHQGHTLPQHSYPPAQWHYPPPPSPNGSVPDLRSNLPPPPPPPFTIPQTQAHLNHGSPLPAARQALEGGRTGLAHANADPSAASAPMYGIIPTPANMTAIPATTKSPIHPRPHPTR